MIPADLQGPLLLAAFMATVVTCAGLPLGLFQPPHVAEVMCECGLPRTRNHVCKDGR